MNFYEVIGARHSMRQFLPDAVDEIVLRRILGAARVAPSACNNQPWHYYVVRDAEVRGKLFAERQQWAATAPVVLVACSTPAEAWVRWADEKNHADIDIAIAMEHIMLAATEEGLGTCWICAFDPAQVKAALNLPEGMEPVAMTPLGLPAAPPRPHQRKSLEEIVTWVG